MKLKPWAMNRRQFLKRGAPGFAALSSSSLALFGPGCSRQTTRENITADGTVIRGWASTVRGEVILPADDPYESARRVWNLAADRHPAVIVQCADVEDVVKAVEFARTHDLLLAVRSGGHSQAGHSVCDGGMVIDLGSMKDLQVNPAAQRLRAEPGVRVNELLKATQTYGLMTPTGGCPDVGIGGLTLGGGENALMAKYGTVCDNVLAAEIVTADGRVLTASAEENPDLYWAIRGGSGNFGIVTSFEYRLYPISQLLVGTLSFPISRTRDVLSRYRDFMRTAPDELQTFGGLMSSPQGSVLAIAVSYCGDATEGEQLVEKLRSISRPASADIRVMQYSADFILPPSASIGTGAFLPELSDDVVEVMATHFETAPPSSTAMWSDYHGAVTRVAIGDMAFPLRQPGYSLFVGSRWNTPAEKMDAVDWVSDFQEAIRPFSRGVYVNNLDQEGEERAREAYGPNYARLASIKAKYDPTNFFHLNQNIRPAR